MLVVSHVVVLCWLRGLAIISAGCSRLLANHHYANFTVIRFLGHQSLPVTTQQGTRNEARLVGTTLRHGLSKV